MTKSSTKPGASQDIMARDFFETQLNELCGRIFRLKVEGLAGSIPREEIERRIKEQQEEFRWLKYFFERLEAREKGPNRTFRTKNSDPKVGGAMDP